MRPLVLTKESNSIKNKMRKPAAKKPVAEKVIKLRVDSRTVILVRTESAMKMWLQKYPKAEVIAQ
jgi:hypothetical protein